MKGAWLLATCAHDAAAGAYVRFARGRGRGTIAEAAAGLGPALKSIESLVTKPFLNDRLWPYPTPQVISPTP